MPSARDIIRAGRRTVHRVHAIPALYYPGANAPAVPITVRLVDGAAKAINAAENRYGLPFNEDVQPQLIFMPDDPQGVDPNTGATVSLEADEVYRVMAVDPPHDITVTAHCIRLSLADCAEYPPPPA